MLLAHKEILYVDKTAVMHGNRETILTHHSNSSIARLPTMQDRVKPLQRHTELPVVSKILLNPLFFDYIYPAQLNYFVVSVRTLQRLQRSYSVVDVG